MKYPNTGPFNVCLRLGQELIKLRQTDEKISFLVPRGSPPWFGAGQSYYRLGLLNKLYLPWERSRYLSNTSQFDLWHSTYQSSMYLPLNKKTKVVLTILDLNFLHERPGDPKNKKYLSLIQNRIDRADHIVGISKFGLNDVRENLKLSKPSSVIYIGAGDKSPLPATAPAAIPKGSFLFCLGTVIPKKNFHVLPCLLEGNDLELIIAGINSSTYLATILDEAKRYGVQSRVTFTGPVSEQEKHWYYEHCAAFLFPSVAEGFGIPPIEAMSHGKPIFLSTSTSLPEIGGDCAYYFKSFSPASMQQAFLAGMKDYEETRPQEKIKQWAAQFNWTNTAAAYLNLYRELLSQAKAD